MNRRTCILTIVIGIATLAFPVIYLCVALYVTHIQARAVTSIRSRGGHIRYQYQFNEYGSVLGPEEKPRGPSWLRAILGDDFFNTAVSVYWYGSENRQDISDYDMQLLEDLPKLRSVSLHFTQVTDAGVMSLRNLADLRELTIWQSKIEGKGLKELSRLKKLRTLTLNEAAISDACELECLRDMPVLECVSFAGTPITDSGVARLSGLQSLRELDLSETRVTDAGILSLNRLPCLAAITVDGTTVGDGAVSHFATFPALELVSLDRTAITDKGVEAFLSVPQNRNVCIYVNGTRVSPLVIDRLVRREKEYKAKRFRDYLKHGK